MLKHLQLKERKSYKLDENNHGGSLFIVNIFLKNDFFYLVPWTHSACVPRRKHQHIKDTESDPFRVQSSVASPVARVRPHTTFALRVIYAKGLQKRLVCMIMN